MTQIKSPTGFVSSLQTALKTASTAGKAVGAPVLKKALQGADAAQLSPQQKSQVRDVFEQVKLTPKARELADQFVGGKGVGIKPPKDIGMVKVRMDDPTGDLKPPKFTPPDGGRVKIRMDDPTGDLKPPKFTPPDGGRVKIRMDDPTGDLKLPDFKPPEDIGVVKVMMDDPTRGSKLPDFKPPEDIGVVKVMMDDPTRGSKLPDFKPLDGGIVKVKMDSPV
ncbi:hypothetical protein [Corallococcus aberystwythensis]|uniref:Uncharacterized protein n=1 Tax=Corallococcus aberystwythensis TaxID=2316722 RepID=A0A3A8QLW5_9BACT|nr:hypothetical protein [Corallococcus aberystwythensis]RKH67355.1 hypothetical protein D7W81_14050 [Corallococcus aberystwythensis]